MSDASWPDPQRLGVPLHPEREAPHWVQDELGSVILARWFINHSIEGPVWAWESFDGYTPANVAAEMWHYLGPCHTPAEVAALIEAARREEREACAVVCEAKAANIRR